MMIKNTNNLLKHNKGFSLVELIVTIAILTIVTSGTFMLVNQNQKKNTLRLAKTIVSSMDSLRLDTMSKGNKQYIHLFKKGNGIYMQISSADTCDFEISTSKKLSSNIPIIYLKGGEDTEKTLIEGVSITIRFVRSTGAFSNDNYYEYIKLGHSSKEVKIECTKITGRFYIK